VPLPHEYLPATGVARGELVLLHGWGSDREVWRPLLALMRPWANITLLDLPGCAPGQTARPLEQVLDDILDCCPKQAVYVGWSLGGQLALELAVSRPARVSALVTICANLRFVADGDWPGMSPEAFRRFCEGVQSDPAAALRRFHALQVTGARRPRALLRGLRRLTRQGKASLDLLTGLSWLETLDRRGAPGTLRQPQLHLQAQRDALVPAISAASFGCPSAQVTVLTDACHLAPLDAPERLASELARFLEDTERPQPGRGTTALEKKDVAASFSRAAASYDSAAHL
jgi:malonyl-CoA O-methyltransferase